MARAGKAPRGMAQGGRPEELPEKPLAVSLYQEFQNLKEKFKNEDDELDAGRKKISS